MIGGKVSVEHLKRFLEASYSKSPPQNIDDYILDKSITNKWAVVYNNPKTGEAVVAHRGTNPSKDWLNNAAYLSGAYKFTDRYKSGKETQDAAERKYGKLNISTLGHSQGGLLAGELGKDTKEIITLNRAYMGERRPKNEYDIRSEADVVSGVMGITTGIKSLFKPKKTEKHNITISAKNINPLSEHAVDILDRLPPNQLIGAGFRAINELNNKQIDLLMLAFGINTYHGCFIADKLPRKIINGFYVLNLNGSSHWTGLCKDDSKYYYFDSFGFPAPDSIDKRKWTYTWSDKQIQDVAQSSCGYFVVAWCKVMYRAKNKLLAYKKFINAFKNNPSFNETKLNQLLKL